MDEFLKALSLIKEIIPEPIEYRLHYDVTGSITQCTMQQHPTDTQYIVVEKEVYDSYYQYYIKDDKVVKIESQTEQRVALVKSESGYRVVAKHAGLLIEPEEIYNNIEHYESNN